MTKPDHKQLIIARAAVRGILDEFRNSEQQSVDQEYARDRLVDWHQAALKAERERVLDEIEDASYKGILYQKIGEIRAEDNQEWKEFLDWFKGKSLSDFIHILLPNSIDQHRKWGLGKSLEKKLPGFGSIEMGTDYFKPYPSKRAFEVWEKSRKEQP